MSGFKSDFLRILSERGFIHQCSDPAQVDELAGAGKLVTYVGYDCTAPSLHIGSLISIMMMRWLQKTGNKPIPLMGGGTTRVGDPSFRDESRPLLDEAGIERNKAGIKTVFSRFLAFGEGPTDAIMVDNTEWLGPLNYIDFLRDVGRHFSVNRMLSFDLVKLRLERDQELSFLEFNYMILQAYDFVELARRYGCRMQMGGSDQWGNIVSGIDLGRRMGTEQLFALTCPLLTTSSGAKMGKTAAGAIWLNADRLSPYDYWQYWRNTEDADVARFLKLYTELPLDEIARLGALEGQELNEAKKVLATEATAVLHGRDAAELSAETARRTFEEGETSSDLPVKEIDKGPSEQWKYGRSNTHIMVAAGFATSMSDARRKIDGRGLKINDELQVERDKIIPWDSIDPTTDAYKVQFGNKIVLVKPKG